MKRLTDLVAGGAANESQINLSDLPARPPSKYDESAYAIAEGKRLFSAFNCTGCHAHGGGDSGPPLMDDKWIYGSEPADIFRTILAGRPNGMPSYGLKIPAYEVWQLTAYVRSMSGLASKDAAPGRDDHMQTASPENSRKKHQPFGTFDDERTMEKQLHEFGNGADRGFVQVPIEQAMKRMTVQPPLQQPTTIIPIRKSYGLLDGGRSNSGRMYAEPPPWQARMK